MAYTRQRTNSRFLTENFQLHEIIKSTEQSALRDWQLKFIKGDNHIAYDVKNCAFCANPSLDFTCYYNYMVFLNQTYDYWVNYGLFDQGFKPLIYLPSFWNNSTVSAALIQMTTIAGTNILRQRGTSLMGQHNAPGPAEYWIHKDDLAKLLDFAEQQFFEKFGVEPKGEFSFGTRDPDKVRPTQLIKVYANMEKYMREAKE